MGKKDNSKSSVNPAASASSNSSNVKHTSPARQVGKVERSEIQREKKPSRIFTLSVKGSGCILVLSKAPMTDLPAYIAAAVNKLKDEETMDKMKVNMVTSLRHPTNPSLNKTVKTTKGLTKEVPVIIRILNNASKNTNDNRALFGNKMAKFATMASKATDMYPTEFVYAGDETPQIPSPLGNYLTTVDVLRVMELSHCQTPLEELVNDDACMAEYFGDGASIKFARTYYDENIKKRELALNFSPEELDQKVEELEDFSDD